MRLIANAAGQAEQSTSYSPYGDPSTDTLIPSTSGAGFVTPEEHGFIGERHDVLSGLLYLNALGSMDDGTMIALAYRVRELELNTHLAADSAIYSGGVDLFLAGVERSMEAGAIIGEHYLWAGCANIGWKAGEYSVWWRGIGGVGPALQERWNV